MGRIRVAAMVLVSKAPGLQPFPGGYSARASASGVSGIVERDEELGGGIERG